MADRDRAAASAAFEAFFLDNYDDVMSFVARRVGENSAADIVADVFLAAWRRWGDFPLNRGRLWLYRTAHNFLANDYRSVRRRDRLAEKVRGSDAVAFVPDIADTVADAELVHSVLALLPWSEQEALRLTEWDGLSAADAAGVAGCAPATFRVRLFRAKRRFAQLVTELERDS